jgi:hypothetical protein
MERRTVKERFSGSFSMHINAGKPQPWCRFDYVVQPDPAIETLEVVMGEAPDEKTLFWFPDLKRGIILGWERLRDYYHFELIGIHIAITKVYSHPIATTSQGCELYARTFIDGIGRYECVPVD